MLLLLIEIALLLINFIIIAIVYRGQRSVLTSIRPMEASFMAFVGSMSLWIIVQILFDYTTNQSQLRLFNILLDLGLVFSVGLVVSFWFFMSQFAGVRYSNSRLVTQFASVIVVTIAGIASKPVYGTINDGAIEFGYNSTLYSIYSLFLLIYFLDGLRYMFLRRYWGNKHSSEKKKRTRLLAGFTLGLICILFGNVAIPLIFSTADGKLSTAIGNSFLALGSTFLSLSAAFSAFNLGVFNFRKFLIRSIVDTIAYILPAILLIIGASYLTRNLTVEIFTSSNSLRAQILFGVIVLGVSLLSVSFRSVSKRVVAKIYSSREFNEQKFVEETEKIIKTENTEEILSKFIKLCSKQLSIDRVAINIEGLADGDLEDLSSYADTGGNTDKPKVMHYLRDIYQKHDNLKEAEFSGIDNVYVGKGDFEYLLSFSQNQIRASLLLGTKLNGRPYYIDEISAVRKELIDVLLAMQNVFRMKKLVEFNASLEDSIQKATKELRMSNAKLKSLDEAKDEFISMASHQLRTPLTSIKGYLSMVLEGDVGDITEQQKKMLSQAFVSSQRMVYLIADLLNVSRLQTGKFIIETKESYLPDVVEEELAQITETAQAKGIELVYEKPQDFTKVFLDETKIRQVIMNFADNAVYYGRSGGKIIVSLRETKNAIEFTVTDNGIGVPKADQHKLFTKFYRAGNARKARPDGTGLGLYMAQKVITASGGSVIFKSKEGVGSTFGFTIPKSKLKTA